MGRLIAPCVVLRLHDDAGTVGTTAIDKQPVEGAVKVGKLGLYADVQADRKHHGGEDQRLQLTQVLAARRSLRRSQAPTG